MDQQPILKDHNKREYPPIDIQHIIDFCVII